MQVAHRIASRPAAKPPSRSSRSALRGIPLTSGALLRVGLLAGLLAGCSNAPSDADCEKLRDKLVDLEFAAMGAKAQTSEAREQIAKQKAETSDGVAARFKESCTKKTPKALIDCALEATSLDAVKACDERK